MHERFTFMNLQGDRECSTHSEHQQPSNSEHMSPRSSCQGWPCAQRDSGEACPSNPKQARQSFITALWTAAVGTPRAPLMPAALTAAVD